MVRTSNLAFAIIFFLLALFCLAATDSILVPILDFMLGITHLFLFAQGNNLFKK